MNGKFTRIQEPFSQTRWLPRLGKIRLGVKKQTASGKTYPSETSYFVCPSEVREIYGDEPTELDILLPVEDEHIFFPQKLAYFGASKGLQCHGNGQVAERKNDRGEWEERACPCEHRRTNDNPKGGCSEMGHFSAILPKVSLGGVYQFTTGSYHSVVSLNSSIDYIRALVGRVALVPLKLRRVAQETHHNNAKQIHYPMQMVLDATVEGVNKLRQDTGRILQSARHEYQIEAPLEENPVDLSEELDDVAVKEESGGEPTAHESEAAPSEPETRVDIAKTLKFVPRADEPIAEGERHDDIASVSRDCDVLSEKILAIPKRGPKFFAEQRRAFGAMKTKYPEDRADLLRFRDALQAWLDVNG